MTLTRRDVLRGAGLALAAAAGASMPAAAQTDYPHWDAQPEHVTLSYDEATLLDYAPRLVLSSEARPKLRGLWGWTATSPEYDSDIHVYVALYTHQDGIGTIGQLLSDSHLGDTEWYYVLSDPDSGETQRVIYDAYHWVAGRQSADSITMDGTHPVASVIDPWHFYAHGDVDASSATEFDAINDLTAEFGAMLRNGLAESLEPGTVTDPATMRSRDHWWRTGVTGWSFDAALASAVYDLGLVGADEADGGAVSF